MAQDLDFVAHIDRESRRFATVLAHADPGRRVPTCPAWKAADLLWHLIDVQWFWGTIACELLQAPERAETDKPLRPSDPAELVSLFHVGRQRLADALRTVPANTPVWTWSRDKSIRFIRRRQAHEALIHRVDAEITADVPIEPLDPALATDGIDEFLRVHHTELPDYPGFQFTPGGLTVRIDTTDTYQSWLMQLGKLSGPDPRTGKAVEELMVQVFGESGDADAVVQGTAADLDRWLWVRGNIRVLHMSGSEDALDQLTQTVDQGMD